MRNRWTQPAAHDITQICDYIEKRGSSATAHRVALVSSKLTPETSSEERF
jgi:plasmid stabilization system protein ParE